MDYLRIGAAAVDQRIDLFYKSFRLDRERLA